MARMWMFHATRAPQGQIFENFDAVTDKDGWVDSPAKLEGYVEVWSDAAVPRQRGDTDTDPNMQFSGNTANTVAVPVGGDILKSLAANERRAVLFDDDGRLTANEITNTTPITDLYVAKAIDAMSREEVVEALRLIGVEPDVSFYTSVLRSELMAAIRPDIDFETSLAAGDGIVEDSDFIPETDAGYQAGDADGDGKSDDLGVDELNALDEDAREAWVLGATKATLHSQIEKRGKTTRVRDGKEELQEQLRSLLPPIED